MIYAKKDILADEDLVVNRFMKTESFNNYIEIRKNKLLQIISFVTINNGAIFCILHCDLDVIVLINYWPCNDNISNCMFLDITTRDSGKPMSVSEVY